MQTDYTLDEGYTARIVATPLEFTNLQKTWNDLISRGCAYTPWFCWEWFELYLRHFSEVGELFIVLLTKGDEVCLIAPFLSRTLRYKGIAGVRTLELIGNAHSTARGFIFREQDKSARLAHLEQLFHFLQRGFRKWDIIRLLRIPEQHGHFETCVTATRNSRLRIRSQTDCGNWHLDGIAYSFQDYFSNQVKANLNIEKMKKQLSRIGDWHVAISTNGESLDDHLDAYDRIREHSWKAPESGKTFVREFTTLAAGKGWLRLALLFSGDVPIAAQKWLVCDGKAYIWDLVYDEGYKKYSPGSILSAELFKYAIDVDKVSEIDYLTGDEPYKKFWTPQRRERKEITIFNKTARGRALSFLMTSLIPVIEKSQYSGRLRDAWRRYAGELRAS